MYNLVVPFVPVWTALEDNETLCFTEEDSKIPAGTITSTRWIKPIAKGSPFQSFAHAMFTLTSPTAANKLLKDGIYINRTCLRALKDKKEPIQCLKCQKWGHIACSCKANKDTCGTCAGDHKTPNCPSEKDIKCVNCDSTDHPSTSKKCPDFIQRCIDLNAKTAENNMPFFPTDEEWTQVQVPPKATGSLVPTRPPRQPSIETSKERTKQPANRNSQQGVPAPAPSFSSSAPPPLSPDPSTPSPPTASSSSQPPEPTPFSPLQPDNENPSITLSL